MIELLEGMGSERPGSPPELELEDALDVPASEQPIRCAACRAVVTSREAKVVVHGAHEHRRVNPSGVDFHVGCFSVAPGCAASGEATLHWTWFPGYAWRMAACRGCGAHLGWAFSGEGSFFGLILPRLVEDEPS